MLIVENLENKVLRRKFTETTLNIQFRVLLKLSHTIINSSKILYSKIQYIFKLYVRIY